MPAKPRTRKPVESFDPDEAIAVDSNGVANFPAIRAVDPEAVIERMAQRIRSADSLDALFDSLTGNSSDALVGKSFSFTDVEWQPYESNRGIIPQAIVTAVDLDTGEQTEFVTTAGMLVEFLRRAEVIGAYPFSARIVEKTTKSGNKALNFERV
jgi:hypothetical protein